MTLLTGPIEFTLPESRWATGPPEERGIPRDGVRLMLAERATGALSHGVFSDLPDHLRPGDIVVVNTSATIPAAVEGRTQDGDAVRLHFASPFADGLWAVEVRTPAGAGSGPGPRLDPQTIALPGGAHVHLLTTHPRSDRLWVAGLEGVADMAVYLARHGGPIGYSPEARGSMADHQTVFAREPGSAEMPSAGRPFSTELVTELVAAGVVVLPIVLHAGVSSFETGESPGDERFRVPPVTARTANTLRSAGGRLVAVGTTVVRALETMAEEDGTIHPGDGVTDLVITPARGVWAVDGLVTGWHEPRSSHLELLETVAGHDLLQHAYHEALATGYLWHEFGDTLLVLP